MKFRALLLGSSLLYAMPALAVVDPPAASKNDLRIRSIIYDANNPVEIYTVPGASLRLEFGADETIVQVIVSDQGTITPDPSDPPPAPTSSIGTLANGTPQIPPSCDNNLCRSIVGNFVYLKPLRELDPQPLFIQTQRVDAFGKPQMVPYTFELHTRVAELPQQPTPAVQHAAVTSAPAADPAPKPVAPSVWGVRFIYPLRAHEAAAAAWQQQKKAREEAAREAASIAHPVVDMPDAAANYRYGYRGAAAVQPDLAWDDGRSTFLRYNGNRRVPNVYSQLPDGHESIPASAPEPDATGNTLRIAHTETKWFIRDGDEAGCLFDLGPDPDGKTSTTVALTAPPARAK
jgi:type IV secretion system protein VirB9